MGMGWLSADERQRHEGFGAADAARRFVAGRALLRSVVGGCLGVEPWALPIDIDDAGKPYAPAADAAGLSFNLSHDGDDLVLAVARARGVGVDVVAMDRRDQAMRIAARMFPALDHARILEATDDPLRVLKIWALKESAAKAEGSTVWKALHDYSFHIEEGAGGQTPGDNRHWVGLYRERCVIAVTTVGAAGPIEIRCRVHGAAGTGTEARVIWSGQVRRL